MAYDITPLLISNGYLLEGDKFFELQLGERNELLVGGSWSSQIIIFNDLGFKIIHVFSKGFLKKQFFFDGIVNLNYENITKAEFGKGNGLLWLQLVINNVFISFTAPKPTWKTNKVSKFLNNIEKHIPIYDKETLIKYIG